MKTSDRRHVIAHISDLHCGHPHFVPEMLDTAVVAVDSSEPDLNEGCVGRGRYSWIRKQFAHPADLRVFVLHHHLVPIPRTGRERSMVTDSGDVLELLTECG